MQQRKKENKSKKKHDARKGGGFNLPKLRLLA
jgi:hypothetical protein